MKTSYVKNLLAASLLASAAACAGTARNLEAYRADTNRLLETRTAQLKRCYDDALKADETLAGTVTVQFVVEKTTGAIANAAVDPARSTAPPALGQCVVRAMDGLTLAPPDRNEGRATFVYEFKPTAAPPS
jgi:hypothetical protein